MIDHKKILKQSAINILIIIIFMLSWHFIPYKNVYTFVAIFFIITTFLDLWVKKVEEIYTLKFWRNKTLMMIFLALFYFVSLKAAAYGAIGIIVLILLLSGYRLYRARSLYMEGLRDIETRIWGKPLDKKEWRKK